MTDYSPFKKTVLSVCCALLLLIYAPLASVVGTDTTDEADFAAVQAETVVESTDFDTNCEKSEPSAEENVSFDEIK